MKPILLLLLLVYSPCFGQRSDFSHIDFKKADSIALLHTGASLNNLPVLTYALTASLNTDVEKFRAIYTWVSTNIENDYGSYLKTSKKRKKLSKNRDALLLWNNGFTPKVFKKLVTHRKTACTGYAYLIKELANLVGIDCKIVNGYGRTASLKLTSESLPNHSWNAVSLNNKWYLCDPTWSAGRIVFEENRPVFKSEYFDGYFLAAPANFIKNHYPLNKHWTLLGKTPPLNTFLEGPIIYKEAFKPAIIPIYPSNMKVEAIKDIAVSFKLKLTDMGSKEHFGLLLVNDSSSKKVTPETSIDKSELTLRYSFKKTGLYDVHILNNDVALATYVVKVKRK